MEKTHFRGLKRKILEASRKLERELIRKGENRMPKAFPYNSPS
jgi:hypothetical protein